MADPQGFLKVASASSRRASGPGPHHGLEGGLRGAGARPSSSARPAAAWTAASRSATGLPARQPHPGVERPRLARRLGRGHRAAARDEQLPRVHRPALPGAVRDRLRARHQPARRDHQAGRGLDHRPGLRRGLGHPDAAGAPVRQDRRRRRLGPRGSRRRPAAHPRRATPSPSTSATTSRAGCCATASPSSRWRSPSSTGGSRR